MRWSLVIKRRKYSVPAPNSLWHLDGHHSLLNWGFVVHGGIDGFSRLITFLRCSTNNKAETVDLLFHEALDKYGVPSRVRTDKGGENVFVWQSMNHLRGENRSSYLAGFSVHNQRIERLWRDVWSYVCSEFYYTFQAMEDEGHLDIENSTQKFLLHYIFVPRINHVINSFVHAWNCHPIRSEHNWSPERLWANGVLDRRNHNILHVAEICEQVDINEDFEWFGMDWQAPVPNDDGLSYVEVFDAEIPIEDEIFSQLRDSLDPMSLSPNYGIDLFLTGLQILDR